MVWYYAEGDRQRGPISDEEFEELVGKGRIHNETLIWKDGMDNWQPLKNVRNDGLASAGPSFSSGVEYDRPQNIPPAPGVHEAPPASQVPPPPQALPGGGEYVAGGAASHPEGSVYCSQCRRGPMAPGTFVTLGNISLCAQCDSDFERYYQQQALRKASGAYGMMGAVGAAASGVLVYASIFARAVAKFLDQIITAVVLMVFMAATTDLSTLGASFQAYATGSPEAVVALRPWLLASMILGIIYDGVLVGWFGATLGKMALGIRVVSGDGTGVTWNQAMLRAVAPVLLQLPSVFIPSSIIAMIAQFVLLFGYLMAVMDPQRRTLFDHVANTRVVR